MINSCCAHLLQRESLVTLLFLRLDWNLVNMLGSMPLFCIFAWIMGSKPLSSTTTTPREMMAIEPIPAVATTKAAWNLPVDKKHKEIMATFATALSVSLAILVADPNSALAQDSDIAKGAELFKVNCAGCHAGGANFVAEKKTLQKEALEKFQSLDAAKLESYVKDGMPHKFLPIKFSDQDYHDTIGYVLDQALNDKW